MYNPRAFQIEDPEVATEFMRRYSFATIVTSSGAAPQASHVPFIVDTSAPGLPMLHAHFAKANPHWQTFDGKREALVIFQGPHGYVSPSLYEVHPAVPTWNYQAVHAYGVPRVVEDPSEKRAHVLALIRHFEAERPQPWHADLPDDYLDGRLREVVAFRLQVVRVEAKFKLSQNRPGNDREIVTATFEASDDAATQTLGRAMRASPGLPEA
jgi:transcriptional regulator